MRSAGKADKRYVIRSPEDAAAYLMTEMTCSDAGAFRCTLSKCEERGAS